MSPPVNSFEIADRDMGIDLRALDILVSQQLLDIADVDTVLEHVGCAGMPHEVAGSLLSDAGPAYIFTHQVGQGATLDTSPRPPQEHGDTTLQRELLRTKIFDESL